MIGPKSRNLLTNVVRVVSTTTGQLTQPEFVDLRQRVSSFANDDVFVTADGASRWANLGFDRLGDAGAWWVVADLSQFIDPFEELTTGAQLRVPSVSRYLFEILAPERFGGQ